jgi:hypothetical protein
MPAMKIQTRSTRAIRVVMIATILTGCHGTPAADRQDPRENKPLPAIFFEGLPLSGNLATARAAGFAACLDGTKGLRCRKERVMVLGVGPLSAAVDLDAAPRDAPARFDHVTLWHATDQGAVLDLGDLLKKAGWQSCLTPDEERYLRPSSPIHLAVDTNYWGIRRVVISAPAPAAKPYC